MNGTPRELDWAFRIRAEKRPDILLALGQLRDADGISADRLRELMAALDSRPAAWWISQRDTRPAAIVLSLHILTPCQK